MKCYRRMDHLGEFPSKTYTCPSWTIIIAVCPLSFVGISNSECCRYIVDLILEELKAH